MASVLLSALQAEAEAAIGSATRAMRQMQGTVGAQVLDEAERRLNRVLDSAGIPMLGKCG